MSTPTKQSSVVSGHQCMFLGGPLFVLIKILGVIHTSKEKSLQPIFWLETNDADFQEIAQIGWINHKKNYQQIKLLRKKVSLPNGFRIGDIPINNDILQQIDEFFTQLPPTKHTETLKNIVFESYEKAENLGDANIALFQNIIKESSVSFRKLAENLVFFDPRQKKFLDFCRPFFLQESLWVKNNQQCPFFAFKNQSRKALFKKDGHFFTRDGEKINLETTTLLPSLLTRSIVQDAYLHTSVYLAGPTEQQYLKQLENQYKKHHLKPSEIVKRMSVVLLTRENLKDIASVKNVMTKKTDATIDEKELLLSFLQMEQQQLLQHITFICTKFDNKQEESLLRKRKIDFIEQLKKNNVELALLKKIEKQIHQYQKHILREKRKKIKEKMSDILPTIEKLSQHIKPQKAQERDLSFLYFLNHFGLGLLEELEKIYTENEKILCESKEKLIKEYSPTRKMLKE